MFGTLFSGVTGYLIVGLLALLLVSGIFAKYAMNRFEQDAQVIALSKQAVQSRDIEITQLKADAADIQKINADLMTIKTQQDNAMNVLNGKLSKINGVSAKKDKLLEDLMNKAAVSRNRCFAIISGSPILKGETNKVCPELFVVKK